MSSSVKEKAAGSRNSEWKIKRDVVWTNRQKQRERARQYHSRYHSGITRIPCGGGFRVVKRQPHDD